MQQRVAGLTEVKRLLGGIRERIRYASEPMEELFSQWGIDLTEEGVDRERWENQVRVWGEQKGISNEDGMIVERFVRGFGLSDVEGSIRYCDEYRDIVEERLQQASEELRNKGRVFMALGICGGLAAGLLLV